MYGSEIAIATRDSYLTSCYSLQTSNLPVKQFKTSFFFC